MLESMTQTPPLQSKTTASGKAKQKQRSVPFSELHFGKSRTEAAQLFFELLVLQARKRVSKLCTANAERNMHQDNIHPTGSLYFCTASASILS